MLARVVSWPYVAEEPEEPRWSVVTDSEPQMFWTPIIGPSAFCAWRQLVTDLYDVGEDFEIDFNELGALIGLTNPGKGKKAIDRLTSFGVAYAYDNFLHVRTHVGVPAARHRETCWPSSLHDLYRSVYADGRRR